MATTFTCSSSPGLQIRVHIILFVFLFFLRLSESVYFDILEFEPDTTDMVYSGDAVVASGDVELNRVDGGIGVGHVKYAHAVQIWDGKSRKLTDFNIRFTFIVDTRGQPFYGYGFAFFLAPVGFEIPFNSSGPYLGVFNATTTDSPRSQMVVVEFDTFRNNDSDHSFGHVGINMNSSRSATLTPWNASLYSGRSADARIAYNATTQMLSVSWRYPSETNTENNNISYQVDLREALPEWVTIGFSGATGSFLERHVLRHWKFSSTLNMVGESEDSSKRKLAVGLTVPLAVLGVGGLVACTVYWSIRRKFRQESLDTVALTSINDDLEGGPGPKRFSYHDLTLATNNFSYDQKLGEGGFGCVYKGYLSREGMVVAVKKISQGSKQGKKEYLAEVKIISILRHRNLVQLIGWCHDQTQFLLVYEFLPNGSLDSHLFRKKNTLEWTVRYKIALGLASALLYLHEECEQCVVHRDIKTSNILLDSGFNVKLGDFGLARLMDHELDLHTTGLAGTIGYMAPEYAITGKASKESDVYSFGVVALEIACGRKAMDNVVTNPDVGLVQWVWSLLGKQELLSGVDQMLKNKFDVKQAECLMSVGLWCAHPDRSLRPSIRQAIQVLKFEGVVPNLPKVMPVPMYFAAPDSHEVSSVGASMTTSSINLAR
ncbi:L-type lectin-domain containing receptor kinase IX.1-like [Cynara cardunculus var. scolymus]|uniref:L-type lectin-domain containing receptor kinase IX.1-like n=1 Tax=Cynara cardunculus var. scolymus TaxID=59895 RepID=UPI000D62B7BA|nr:L-type lectin-domain containing receptor kinase IX.1-like [Cynara cardunculus var. scolymus]